MNKNLVCYPAVFDDSENGEKEWYTITFPDIPGAISEAHGLPKALYNAEQVLGLALYDVAKDKLPDPTPLEDVVEFCRENYPHAKVYPIVSNLEEAKKEVKPVMVKKNTRIPGALAAEAENAGINFSQLLTEALKSKLKLQ